VGPRQWKQAYFIIRVKILVLAGIRFCQEGSSLSLRTATPANMLYLTVECICYYPLYLRLPVDGTLAPKHVGVTIQINHQLDATISPAFYLTFIYSSTCFGRPHAHHQELNKCSSSFWLYNRPDHEQQHCYHQAPKVKPEAATAVVELLMMGVMAPETCWAVNKRQVINWINFCT